MLPKKFKKREQKQEEREARHQQQKLDGELVGVDASEDEEVHYLGTVDPEYGKSNQSSSSPYHF